MKEGIPPLKFITAVEIGLNEGGNTTAQIYYCCRDRAE